MIKLHELLEVEENEEFRVRFENHPFDVQTYKIMANNLYILEATGRIKGEKIAMFYKCDLSLNLLEEFKNNIIRKSKFPKEGTTFCYIDEYGDVNETPFFRDCERDFLKYKLGNFYLTKEEGEANKEKWINFYKDATQIKWEE